MESLEEVGFASLTLVGLVVILLTYVDDVTIIVRSPYDLDTHLKNMENLCCRKSMTININKTNVMIIKSNKITETNFGYDKCFRTSMTININTTKVMIIKSKKVTYTNLGYDKCSLHKVNLYTYIGINIHHMLNSNYSIEKRIYK